MPNKPAPDLDAMTVAELTAHIATAQAKVKEKQQAAKATLLAKWKAEAAENDLPFESVIAPSAAASGRKRRAGNGSLPVKFRGPNGEEWSGRGRLPKWVQEAETAGRKREEFLVKA